MRRTTLALHQGKHRDWNCESVNLAPGTSPPVESDMNNTDTKMELEAGVVVLGLAYAASLLSIIAWLL